MRGGHQMCIDYQQQLIFLLGGWDGIKDLPDLWVYNIRSVQWQCISENTKLDVCSFLLLNVLHPHPTQPTPHPTPGCPHTLYSKIMFVLFPELLNNVAPAL